MAQRVRALLVVNGDSLAVEIDCRNPRGYFRDIGVGFAWRFLQAADVTSYGNGTFCQSGESLLILPDVADLRHNVFRDRGFFRRICIFVFAEDRLEVQQTLGRRENVDCLTTGIVVKLEPISPLGYIIVPANFVVRSELLQIVRESQGNISR